MTEMTWQEEKAERATRRAALRNWIETTHWDRPVNGATLPDDYRPWTDETEGDD